MGPAMDLFLGPLFSGQGRMSRTEFRRAYGVWGLILAAMLPLSPIAASLIAYLAVPSIARLAKRRHQDLVAKYEKIDAADPFNLSTFGGFFAAGSFLFTFSGFWIAASEGWPKAMLLPSTFFILPGLLFAIPARSLFLSPSYPHANTYGPNPQEVST